MSVNNQLKPSIESQLSLLKDEFLAYAGSWEMPKLKSELIPKLFPEIPSSLFINKYYSREIYLSKGNQWHNDYSLEDFQNDLMTTDFNSEHVHYSYAGKPVINEMNNKIEGQTILNKMKDEKNFSFRVAPAYKYASQPEIFLQKIELLESIFGAEVGLISFFSKENESVLPRHWDTEDLIICQISGKKKWVFYENLFKQPLRQQKFGFDSELCRFNESSKIEIELEPGDVLYLPKGVGHHAVASSGDSLHFTYGIYHPSASDLLEQYLKKSIEIFSMTSEARISMSCYDTTADVFSKSKKRFLEILSSFDTESFLAEWSIQYRLFNKERIETVMKIDLGEIPKILKRSFVRFRLVEDKKDMKIHVYGQEFIIPLEHHEIFLNALKLEEFSPELISAQYDLKSVDFFLSLVRKLRLFI